METAKGKGLEADNKSRKGGLTCPDEESLRACSQQRFHGHL